MRTANKFLMPTVYLKFKKNPKKYFRRLKTNWQIRDRQVEDRIQECSTGSTSIALIYSSSDFSRPSRRWRPKQGWPFHRTSRNGKQDHRIQDILENPSTLLVLDIMAPFLPRLGRHGNGCAPQDLAFAIAWDILKISQIGPRTVYRNALTSLMIPSDQVDKKMVLPIQQ